MSQQEHRSSLRRVNVQVEPSPLMPAQAPRNRMGTFGFRRGRKSTEQWPCKPLATQSEQHETEGPIQLFSFTIVVIPVVQQVSSVADHGQPDKPHEPDAK